MLYFSNLCVSVALWLIKTIAEYFTVRNFFNQPKNIRNFLELSEVYSLVSKYSDDYSVF